MVTPSLMADAADTAAGAAIASAATSFLLTLLTAGYLVATWKIMKSAQQQVASSNQLMTRQHKPLLQVQTPGGGVVQAGTTATVVLVRCANVGLGPAAVVSVVLDLDSQVPLPTKTVIGAGEAADVRSRLEDVEGRRQLARVASTNGSVSVEIRYTDLFGEAQPPARFTLVGGTGGWKIE